MQLNDRMTSEASGGLVEVGQTSVVEVVKGWRRVATTLWVRNNEKERPRLKFDSFQFTGGRRE